jgi:hypothetical protein
MKLTKFLLALVAAVAFAGTASAHWPVKTSGETLLLIPSRGSALIIIENSSRFDPTLQRLLAEGEIKRWFVLDQPLVQIPIIQSDGYLNELQIRQLDEFLRR